MALIYVKRKQKIQGSRFKVQGSRFKVEGSRLKVEGKCALFWIEFCKVRK